MFYNMFMEYIYIYTLKIILKTKPYLASIWSYSLLTRILYWFEKNKHISETLAKYFVNSTSGFEDNLNHIIYDKLYFLCRLWAKAIEYTQNLNTYMLIWDFNKTMT